MSDISGKFHRKCGQCEKSTWTGAKTRFKCRHCGVWTRITHTRPLKPAKTSKFMKTGIDQYVDAEPEAGA